MTNKKMENKMPLKTFDECQKIANQFYKTRMENSVMAFCIKVENTHNEIINILLKEKNQINITTDEIFKVKLYDFIDYAEILKPYKIENK